MDKELDGDLLVPEEERILEAVSPLQFLIEGTRKFVMDVLVREFAPQNISEMERFDFVINSMIEKRSEENKGVNYEKIKERIRAALRQAEKHIGKELSNFEIQFLTHFWEQHLRRSGIFPTILKYVDPETNFYPAGPEYTGIAQKTLHHFVANYSEVRENFDQVAPEIQEILKNSSLAMVMNHDAWTTHIISSLLAHEGLEDFPIERNRIILGPAILTASQWGILDPEKTARAVSSIYSTIPDTSNGRPEDLDQGKLQYLAGRAVVKVMQDMKNAPTKIFHISPSATTDIRDADGTLTMKTVADGTAHFLSKILNELNIPICLIGMNHNGMYANGKLRKKPVHIQFGPIIYPGELTGSPREITNQIMELLAKNVRDSEGRQIGRYEKVN